MKYNVFIDGAEGTTGLKIHQYFQKREDIQVLKIEEAKRKDMEARLALIRQADISFLCLPDAAAKRSQKRRRRIAGSWTPLRLIVQIRNGCTACRSFAARRETKSKKAIA